MNHFSLSLGIFLQLYIEIEFYRKKLEPEKDTKQLTDHKKIDFQLIYSYILFCTDQFITSHILLLLFVLNGICHLAILLSFSKAFFLS